MMKTKLILIVILLLFLTACTAAISSESTPSDGSNGTQMQSVSSNVLSDVHTESFFGTSSENDVILLPEDSSMTEGSSIEESSEPESSESEQIKTVLLDPGHGFGDVGCSFVNSNMYEKQITVILASKIGAELEKRGIRVLYTHDGKSFVTCAEMDELADSLEFDHDEFLYWLVKNYSGRTEAQVMETLEMFHGGLIENTLFNGYERCYYANLLDAQQEISLLVSVHVNTNTDSDRLRGFELFYCSDTPYAEDSDAAMQYIKNALREQFSDKEARTRAYSWDDAYIVNKYIDMPSVLIESGYATTLSEAVDLQNELWQNDFAATVAEGILRFLSET